MGTILMPFKEELWQIGQFQNGNNIKPHIFNIEQKIKELKIEEEKQALFFKKSLHQDALHEECLCQLFTAIKINSTG